eukprot:gb/GECG01002658.1/.p1 GENE.gb/GECG01002658.1/~~gb/GECG01002658.1/.p1  ORF type:complete len:981 (+),score=129.76 gb/GECG01002658.1/:1-2943(+)
MAAAGEGAGSALTGWESDAFDTEVIGVRSSLSSLSPPPSPPAAMEQASDEIKRSQTQAPVASSSSSSQEPSVSLGKHNSGTTPSSFGQQNLENSKPYSHSNSSSTIAGAIHRFRNMPPMPREKRQQQRTQDQGSQSTITGKKEKPHFWWQETPKRHATSSASPSSAGSVCGTTAKVPTDSGNRTSAAHHIVGTNTSAIGNTTETKDVSMLRPPRNWKEYSEDRAPYQSGSFSESFEKSHDGKKKRRSIESSAARKSLEEEADNVFRKWLSDEHISRSSQRQYNSAKENIHPGDSLDDEIEDAGQLDLGGQYSRVYANTTGLPRKPNQARRAGAKHGKRRPQSAAAVAEELSYAFRALFANKKNQEEYRLAQRETGPEHYGRENFNAEIGENSEDEDYNRQRLLKKVMNSLDMSVKCYRHLVRSSEKARKGRSKNKAKRFDETKDECSSSDSSLESLDMNNYWHRKRAMKSNESRKGKGSDGPSLPIEGLEFGVRVSTQMENTLAECGESNNETSEGVGRDSFASLHDAIHQAGLLTPSRNPQENREKSSRDTRVLGSRETWERRGSSAKEHDDEKGPDSRNGTAELKSTERVMANVGPGHHMKWTDLAFASVGESPQQCLPFIRADGKRHRQENAQQEMQREGGNGEEKEREGGTHSGGNVPKSLRQEVSHFQTLTPAVAMASYKPVVNFRYPGRQSDTGPTWEEARGLANSNYTKGGSSHGGTISNVVRYYHSTGSAPTGVRPTSILNEQPRHSSKERAVNAEEHRFSLAKDNHNASRNDCTFHGQGTVPLSTLQQSYSSQRQPRLVTHSTGSENRNFGDSPRELDVSMKGWQRELHEGLTRKEEAPLPEPSYAPPHPFPHQDSRQSYGTYLNIAESPIVGSTPATLSPTSGHFDRTETENSARHLAGEPSYPPNKSRVGYPHQGSPYARAPLGVSDAENRHAVEGMYSEKEYVEKAKQFLSSTRILRQQIESQMLSAH